MRHSVPQPYATWGSRVRSRRRANYVELRVFKQFAEFRSRGTANAFAGCAIEKVPVTEDGDSVLPVGITNLDLEVVMLSPLSKLFGATVLALAFLALPALTSASSATAYAGDSRRYDNDDKDHYKDSKKYSKNKKYKNDDDDDDRRYRGRIRFDRDDWQWRNRRQNDCWWPRRGGRRY